LLLERKKESRTPFFDELKQWAFDAFELNRLVDVAYLRLPYSYGVCARKL
jgi:hypothetical protein